jgi:hypothetical protein
LVGGLLTWTYVASSYRSDFSASLVRSPECTGGTVHRRQLGSDEAAEDVIGARPGLHCTLTLRYTNSAPVTLHLGSAVFPYLGRDSGLLIRMYGVGVRSPRIGRYVGGGIAYSTDAHVPLDRDLAAGQSFTSTYTLRFNPTGCSAGTTWVHGMPVVEVSALGLTGTVTGSIPIAVDGDHHGCPD